MLFIMVRRESNAIAGRCFNIIGEILSNPDTVVFRELIARVNSDILN